MIHIHLFTFIFSFIFSVTHACTQLSKITEKDVNEMINKRGMGKEKTDGRDRIING